MKEISIIRLILPNGRLVMQRRDDDTEVSPGLLGFFGGHIEKGELPIDAMRRELSEETSIDISQLKIKHITTKELPHPKDPSTTGLRAHFYSTKISSDSFNVYEGQRAETFTLAELKQRQDLAPTAKYMVDNFGDTK